MTRSRERDVDGPQSAADHGSGPSSDGWNETVGSRHVHELPRGAARLAKRSDQWDDRIDLCAEGEGFDARIVTPSLEVVRMAAAAWA